MGEKLHKVLRILQWLIPTLITFYGVLDVTFAWGRAAAVETVAAGLVAMIGAIAEHSSATYFADKDIVQKESK